MDVPGFKVSICYRNTRCKQAAALFYRVRQKKVDP